MASAKIETVVLPYVLGIGPVEGKVTPVRPLWEGAASRMMPALTFGHRRGGAFAFMSIEDVGKASTHDLAMRNLVKAEASWVETEIEDEDGAMHRALVCQDNFCATEKILDSRFMNEGQRLLGAKSLMVGIPVRSVMLAMDDAKRGAARKAFLLFGLSLFRSGEGIPVTPALFQLKDGRIESFFAEDMEPFADELETRLQGDFDDDDFDDEEDEDLGPTIELATNAPDRWPVVEVPESVLDDPDELSIQVTSTLDDAFDDDVDDLGRHVFHMTEGGFVELANEIIEGDRRTGILVYSQATPEAAAHFLGAQEALRQVGVETVYYAPGLLPAAAPGRATVPFSPEILKMRVVTPEPDSYGTWWSVPGDESLLRSETYRCIERAYVAMKGFEPVLFARIAKAIEMDGASKRRLLPLPIEEQDEFVRGPDNRTLVFSVSAEKGLLFGFPMKDTSLEWRNRFWRLYAEGIETIAAELERAGTIRRASDPLPLDWLRTAARHNEEMELEAGEIRVFRLLQTE